MEWSLLIDTAEVIAGSLGFVEDILKPRGREAHVEEAWRRHLHIGERSGGRALLQRFGQGFSDLQGRAAHRARQPHGQVGGDVPVFGVGWSLDLDLGLAFRVNDGKGPILRGVSPGLADQRADARTYGQDGWRCVRHQTVPTVTTSPGSASRTVPGKTSVAASSAAPGS